MSDWAPEELAPGLWRWTAAHPEWVPDAEVESPGDWEELVGCVAWMSGGAFAFIDPLLPADGAGFWRWAEAKASPRGAWVLTTLAVHRRDRELVAERLGASTSRAAATLPAGVEPMPLRGAAEVAFWLEPQRALVFGDRVIADGDGGLRMCPESWLRWVDVDTAALAELLRPLLELPIERVIVSHGEPVLADGRAALERAIS